MKPSSRSALEVVQHQNAFALLDDTSIVGAQLPALRYPKGTLPRVTPALLLHTKRHSPRGVLEPGTVPGGISAAMDPFRG